MLVHVLQNITLCHLLKHATELCSELQSLHLPSSVTPSTFSVTDQCDDLLTVADCCLAHSADYGEM